MRALEPSYGRGRYRTLCRRSYCSQFQADLCATHGYFLGFGGVSHVRTKVRKIETERQDSDYKGWDDRRSAFELRIGRNHGMRVTGFDQEHVCIHVVCSPRANPGYRAPKMTACALSSVPRQFVPLSAPFVPVSQIT